MELYIDAIRVAGRTGGAAIDPGRPHGIDKGIVEAGVAGQDGCPSGVVTKARLCSFCRAFAHG
jgi:hypothetical protein